MPKHSTLHRIFMQNVRQRRRDLALTQSEVAERLGVSQPSYAALEGGKSIPGLEVVERVAIALETTPLELLGVGVTITTVPVG